MKLIQRVRSLTAIYLTRNRQKMFNALDKRDREGFLKALKKLQDAGVDILRLRDNGFNVLQLVCFGLEDQENFSEAPQAFCPTSDGYGWGELFSDSSARYHVFFSKALVELQDKLQLSVENYITADKPEHAPFVILAGIDTSTKDLSLGYGSREIILRTITRIIDQATPEQKTRLKQLADLALQAAVRSGDPEVIRILIQGLNANPNQLVSVSDQEDLPGSTILENVFFRSTRLGRFQQIAAGDCFPWIQALLESGAYAHMRNQYGRTIQDGYLSPRVVSLLKTYDFQGQMIAFMFAQHKSRKLELPPDLNKRVAEMLTGHNFDIRSRRPLATLV